MSRANDLINLIESLIHLNEMANLDPIDTGLDIYMYVSPKQGSHGPRVKIANTKQQLDSGNTLSISISDNPKIEAGDIYVNPDKLKQIYEFIKINKHVLEEFWNKKIKTSRELIGKITKYGETPRLDFVKVDISKFTIFVAKKMPGNEPQVKFGIGKDSYAKNEVLTLNIETGKQISNTANISPKEFNDIKIWLSTNRKLLMEYWNTNMSLEEFEHKLRK